MTLLRDCLLGLSTNLSYRTPIRIAALFARIDAARTSRYNTGFSGDPRPTQGPYTWLNVRIGVNLGRTQIAPWGKNLLDRLVTDYDAPLNLLSSDPATSPGFSRRPPAPS